LIQFANQILIVRFPAIGRTIRTIPTSTQTLDIKKTTVVDLNGNPIVVAGVVTFVLTDTIKAAFGTRKISLSVFLYKFTNVNNPK